MTLFTEPEKKIIKLAYKHKKLPTAQPILRKKNEARGIRRPDFRVHYKATVIKTVCYWHKNRHTNQWNRTESLEISHALMAN